MRQVCYSIGKWGLQKWYRGIDMHLAQYTMLKHIFRGSIGA